MMSCTEDGNTIGFSNKTDENFQTVYIDTFTVKLSTVLMDSIRTSGSGRLLLGNHTNSYYGKISSDSYFNIAPSSWTLEDANAIYDSMKLILVYDGYYYGDTLQPQKLIVTRLSQNIKGRKKKDPYQYDDIPYPYFYGDGSMYNTSTVKDFSTPIGTKTFNPYPLRKDSLIIPISDDLGKEWFNMKKAESELIVADDQFVQYFKGLKLTTESSANAAVLGFAASTAHIRMYYHYSSGSDEAVDSHHDFAIYNSTLQFNHIAADRSGTLLGSMVPFKALPSEQTNNAAFVQAGGGMMTKVEIPYISKLFEIEENVILIQASLEVVPELNGASTTDLPPTLSLYYTNSTNVPLGQIMSNGSSSSPQAASLVTDDEYEKKASYEFTLTNYMSQIIKKNSVFDYDILIGNPATSFVNEVTAARLGNGISSDSEVKLKIYYTTY